MNIIAALLIAGLPSPDQLATAARAEIQAGRAVLIEAHEQVEIIAVNTKFGPGQCERGIRVPGSGYSASRPTECEFKFGYNRITSAWFRSSRNAIRVHDTTDEIENTLHFGSQVAERGPKGCHLLAPVWYGYLSCTCSYGDNALCACTLGSEQSLHYTKINACDWTAFDDTDASDCSEH